MAQRLDLEQVEASRMRLVIVLLAMLFAIPAAAQIQSRPTDPPLVTAANESWYQLREPVQFAGELYYPAGATLFFNGNTMVRTGHYNGVPLYADATVEPYSVVLVPVGRGLMQPYERPRRGDLAGTTGSRPPSFPVELTRGAGAPPMAAASPTAPPATVGAIGVFTPDPVRPVAAAAVREPNAVGTTGVIVTSAPVNTPPVVSLLRPENNDGIWVRFLGEKWISAGPAVPFARQEFVRVGDYGRFPVFARRDLQEDVIYIPTRAGLVAPYRLKE
jgi:hypothetical protein